MKLFFFLKSLIEQLVGLNIFGYLQFSDWQLLFQNPNHGFYQLKLHYLHEFVRQFQVSLTLQQPINLHRLELENIYQVGCLIMLLVSPYEYFFGQVGFLMCFHQFLNPQFQDFYPLIRLSFNLVQSLMHWEFSGQLHVYFCNLSLQ